MHQQSIFEILGYTIPEVKTQKEWVIQFSVRDKVTQKRRRVRFKILKLQRQNDLVTAQFLCDQLKTKLSTGWVPEKSQRLFKKPTPSITVTDGIIQFMKSPGVLSLRSDSIRSYRTSKNLLLEYLKVTRKEKLLTKDFTRVMASDLMEYAWENRDIGNRSYNNYLENMKRFFKYFESKNYCEYNPFEKIQMLQTTQKNRTFIKPYDRQKIAGYLRERPEFKAMVLLGFWGLVRRTEMTRIRIMDIEWDKKIINLEGAKTKNKRYRFITLNDELLDALKDLNLNMYPPTHFLFSSGFAPGPKQLCPTRISEAWKKMRETINISSKIVFYSLRDSGIVQYIANGVPLNEVAEQAGHQDLKETTSYAVHAKKNPNEAIANSPWKF